MHQYTLFIAFMSKMRRNKLSGSRCGLPGLTIECRLLIDASIVECSRRCRRVEVYIGWFNYEYNDQFLMSFVLANKQRNAGTGVYVL
jgi:hypothetical protein